MFQNKYRSLATRLMKLLLVVFSDKRFCAQQSLCYFSSGQDRSVERLDTQVPTRQSKPCYSGLLGILHDWLPILADDVIAILICEIFIGK
ncbi:hypothetical protein SDC9_207660 [bioreactor metagenome]|uniref:Uncharacterized protein n=1 Tax=bioreactor metagenome TaxID=1076179 RepID=A0A645J971_9ZZZZ